METAMWRKAVGFYEDKNSGFPSVFCKNKLMLVLSETNFNPVKVY